MVLLQRFNGFFLSLALSYYYIQAADKMSAIGDRCLIKYCAGFKNKQTNLSFRFYI